ncbi:hypothetical protein WA016_02960 [Myxococcus stipitatus]
MAVFVGSDESVSCKAVVNPEGRYSLRPVGRLNSFRWIDKGFPGVRADCLTHLNKTWTDMCPRSLRCEQMP